MLFRSISNASARHPLGLSKLTQVCHGIFSFFFRPWNGGNKPSRSDDALLKGYTSMKEGKREGSFRDRKMQGPGRIRREKRGGLRAQS